MKPNRSDIDNRGDVDEIMQDYRALNTRYHSERDEYDFWFEVYNEPAYNENDDIQEALDRVNNRR